MPAIRWISLILLSLGYGLALSHGELTLPAMVTFGLLIMAGVCVTQFRQPVIVGFGHALFLALAVALASHWLPGFFSERVIAAQRFSEHATPYSMYLNLDKPLIGFWILLACPWALTAVRAGRVVKTWLLMLLSTSLLCLSAAMALGVIGWAPKWPEQSTLWLLNNLLLVTLTEELLFRAYLQGGLQHLMRRIPWGSGLALGLAATLFGLLHLGGGWQWALLAGIAGIGYGLAWRYGGLPAAVATHFGVNLLHFSLFTYPMFDR